jgi:type I restriction enzyme R subunit
MDFLVKFQEMVEAYNAGSMAPEEMLRQLVEFIRSLQQEDQRAIGEELTEEELAVYDLLTKPEPKLNRLEGQKVKSVARELLTTLKRQKLVLDWRKKQQAKADVELTIRHTLDGLPETYTRELYQQKCNLVYQHIFESYWGEGKSVYSA